LEQKRGASVRLHGQGSHRSTHYDAHFSGPPARRA
jgi:hypothetical protein